MTDAKTLRIEGYASLFDRVDLAGDIVRSGAFSATLAARGASGVRMLFQHALDEPIGVWDVVEERARGLFVSGRIIASGARGRVAADLVRDRAVDGLSIGFRAVRSRQRADGVRELLEIELWEVSIVTFPMAPQARLIRVGAGRSECGALEAV